MRRLFVGLYLFALSSTLALGSYHFFLPVHARWAEQVQGSTGIMQWAIFILNFDWALAVLLYSALLLAFAVKPRQDCASKRLASNVFAGFWAVHAAYLYVHPFPLPAELRWISATMFVFPVITCALLLLGNRVFRSAGP